MQRCTSRILRAPLHSPDACMSACERARAGYGAEVCCWVVGLGVSAKHTCIARARKRRRAV
eukprot:7276448-Prymnesium_polylepis.1